MAKRNPSKRDIMMAVEREAVRSFTPDERDLIKQAAWLVWQEIGHEIEAAAEEQSEEVTLEAQVECICDCNWLETMIGRIAGQSRWAGKFGPNLTQRVRAAGMSIYPLVRERFTGR